MPTHLASVKPLLQEVRSSRAPKEMAGGVRPPIPTSPIKKNRDGPNLGIPGAQRLGLGLLVHLYQACQSEVYENKVVGKVAVGLT